MTSGVSSADWRGFSRTLSGVAFLLTRSPWLAQSSTQQTECPCRSTLSRRCSMSAQSSALSSAQTTVKMRSGLPLRAASSIIRELISGYNENPGLPRGKNRAIRSRAMLLWSSLKPVSSASDIPTVIFPTAAGPNRTTSFTNLPPNSVRDAQEVAVAHLFQPRIAPTAGLHRSQHVDQPGRVFHAGGHGGAIKVRSE